MCQLTYKTCFVMLNIFMTLIFVTRSLQAPTLSNLQSNRFGKRLLMSYPSSPSSRISNDNFQRMETSYRAQKITSISSKAEFETSKVLLVVEKLEKLQINKFISNSTVQKLIVGLAHMLPFSLITRFANGDSPSLEYLISYVSKIYHNMDVGLIVASLVSRGFVSTSDDTMNRLKISIVLIALFKMKDTVSSMEGTKQLSIEALSDEDYSKFYPAPSTISSWAS